MIAMRVVGVGPNTGITSSAQNLARVVLRASICFSVSGLDRSEDAEVRLKSFCLVSAPRLPYLYAIVAR